MAVTPKKRFSILERDGFMCKYCGGKPPFVQLEVDHIIPKSKGGKDTEDNLITSCSVCNIGKGSKTIGECEKDLWKKKVNDCVYKLKMEFYDEWNKNRLGSIDEKTRVLLSLFITREIKGSDGKKYKQYYDYEYFKLEIKPQDIDKWRKENDEIWESRFKLGSEFCDEVLCYIYSDTRGYVIDLILNEDIMNDDNWKEGVKYSDRLNYQLTRFWGGEFYVIKKYTLFPNAFDHEV